MPGTPIDWNVVVVGAWNIAILTPEGIVRRMFQLPSGTPVEVQVPLDRQAPIRVKHRDIVVSPSSTHLVVGPVEQSLPGISASSQIVQRALASLPETPLQASGINFRYIFDEFPDDFIRDLGSPMEDRLADHGHQTMGKVSKYILSWEPGTLNVEVHQPASGRPLVTVNFHLNSTENRALQDWIGRVEEMHRTTCNLLRDCMNLMIEGANDN